MAARKILIFGATGKQGGSTLKALLDNSTGRSRFTYLAVTRNLSSPKAQRLASNDDVSVLKGDLVDPKPTFKAVKEPVWGVFLVTMPGKNEELFGRLAIDQAIDANVKHLVFASVDRADNNLATDVPHFASKHGIEQYLMKRAKETGMTWTILRPVCFMDNYMNNIIGRGFAAMYHQLGQKKLQLVASEDIGFWGAKAFHEAQGWGRNNAISIAGDELTYSEAAGVFKEKTGRNMPTTFDFFGTIIKKLSHEMGSMFGWFANVGWNNNIEKLRKEQPSLKTWGAWLEVNSDFKDEIKAYLSEKHSN